MHPEVMVLVKKRVACEALDACVSELLEGFGLEREQRERDDERQTVTCIGGHLRTPLDLWTLQSMTCRDLVFHSCSFHCRFQVSCEAWAPKLAMATIRDASAGPHPT